MIFLLLAISTLACSVCTVLAVRELRREQYATAVPYVYSALLFFFSSLLAIK